MKLRPVTFVYNNDPSSTRQFGLVAEEVRHAMTHDVFYEDKDPAVFGRAVVGAVSDAVGYFLTHPGVDADSLAQSLCVIFAP